MKGPCLTGVVVVAVLLAGCDSQPAASPQASQELPYHSSGDFQTQVIYLSKIVAIQKYLSVYPDGDVKASFSLGKVHWVEPELAADTGDRFDESVKGEIKRVGVSEDGLWLLAESEELGRGPVQTITNTTALLLASGKLHSAADISKEHANPSAILSTKLEPVELFFDRHLILLLQKAKR
jgi:hypothetical protein